MASNFWSNKAKVMAETGELGLAGLPLKVVLSVAAYVPSRTHSFVSSIGANELSTGGYTPGFGSASRKLLTGQAVTQDDVLNLAKFTFSAATWPNIGTPSGVAVAQASLVREMTSDADSPILFTWDLVGVTLVGSDLTLTPVASGAATLT